MPMIAPVALALTVCLVAALMPALAVAHPGGPLAHSAFLSGVFHPLGGVDHLLAMVAVGWLAARIGGRALWCVPLAFVALMITGGLLAGGQAACAAAVTCQPAVPMRQSMASAQPAPHRVFLNEIRSQRLSGNPEQLSKQESRHHHIGHRRAGQRLQILRRQPEDAVRMPRGGPDFAEAE